MRQIAITLIHNKANNEAQIESLLPLIEKHTEIHEEEVRDRTVTEEEEKYLDEFGVEQVRMVTKEVLSEPYTATFETYYYTLKGLPEYSVKFYQIVPYGVERPANMHLIDSHNVFYGEGDEDKMGDHPRFINWAVKRGTDQGAEVALVIENANKFNIDDLAIELNTLLDPDIKTEYIQNEACKQITVKQFREKGQIDETKSIAEAVEKYSDIEVVVKGEIKNG